MSELDNDRFLSPDNIRRVFNVAKAMEELGKNNWKPVDGICISCATMKPCLVSTVGWICPECFHTCMRDRKFSNRFLKPGESITIPPPRGMKVFVVESPPGVYLTVENTMFTFSKREIAEKFLEMLGLVGPKAHDVRIVEEEATKAFLYVVSTPPLSLKFVEAFKDA